MSRKVPVGRVLALARPEWKRLLAATLFLLVASAMGLAYPQAVRYVIDGTLGEQASRLIVDRAALFMLIAFVIQGVAIAGRYVLFTIAGERVVTRLRATLYRSLVAQEIAFFDERRTGELVSRLGTDTGLLQQAVSYYVSVLLRNVVQLGGGLALLTWTSPKLTLLMLAVAPPIVVGAVVIGRRVRRLSRQMQDALAGAAEVADETLGGIRTVRAFAAEEVEARRYRAAVERSFQLARRRAYTVAGFLGAGSFAAYAAVAVVLWFGGRQVLAGTMTVGALTSFVLYTLIVAFAVGALGELWTELMRAAGAAERVFELIDRPPAIPIAGGLAPERCQGHVVLDDVRFRYPSRRDVEVLGGIDLELRPGEVVALVGPSGAGKSTIASLLLRFYDPESGRITLDGHDLRELDPAWLRHRVGFVAQEPLLFSSTVAENIRYAREGAGDAEVEAAARAAHAHEFITGFPDGYATLVGERGIQLSGGQKQRVAIARAVLADPRLLILDEATSALDAESERLVKDALEALQRGRTTLIIAHRLSTVIDADRVVVLDRGRVVQTGAHAALMAQEGLYRKLVERQLAAWSVPTV